MLGALYDAAVAGAAPGPLTTVAVRDLAFDVGRHVHVFALGKAAGAMSAAAVERLTVAHSVVAGGLIVAPDAVVPTHPAVASAVGDHPLPGRRSFDAARRLGRRIAEVGPTHDALVLLSGGATSLVAAPLPGLAEVDIVRLFDVLHRAGIDIGTMNLIRKRFLRWAAGRLATELAAARTAVLILSDVPGDDPRDVASGPCAPDDATSDDVLESLRAAGLLGDLPDALRLHLELVRDGRLAETPKHTHRAFAAVTTLVIGSNRLAVDAAVARARELSVAAEAAIGFLEGDAALRGDEIAMRLLERAERGVAGCVVWGGETIVPRALAEGLGGRCQELALAAARRLARGGHAARRVAILAAGTDGRDGPTDAAGAFADASVWASVMRAGVDADAALAHHASHEALQAAGALFRVPPTGTNVMDVVIGLVE